MFDILKNLITKFQAGSVEQSNDLVDNEQGKSNFITFELDQDNKPHVLLDLDNLSTESAKQLGILLFLLNEGYYVQPVLDVLLAISKQDVQKNLFVQTVMSNWSSHIAADNKKIEEPLIKPTQFNSKG